MSNQLSKKEAYDQKKQAKEQARDKAKKQAATKREGMWTVAILVLVGIVFAMSHLGASTPSDPHEQTALLSDATFADDQFKGPEDARVVLVEYADFQCPACGAYFGIVKQLSEDFADDVKIVFRHFPLRTIHPHADLAARASEAAGLQGKFWEMHDKIFEEQRSWSRMGRPRKAFIGYAEDVGLDLDQFEKDLDSKEVKDKIDQSVESALLLGINSTPTFALNGKRIPNPQSLNEFASLLQSAIDDGTSTE